LPFCFIFGIFYFAPFAKRDWQYYLFIFYAYSLDWISFEQSKSLFLRLFVRFHYCYYRKQKNQQNKSKTINPTKEERKV